MTISEQQNAYIACASGLGDYQSMSKLELANGYCEADEAGDEVKRSQYWAALMLRYWYKIYAWMKDSDSCKLQPEDFIDWLNDALYIAFYYRSWWWEYEVVAKHGKIIEYKLDENGNRIPNPHHWKLDPAAADRSINYFCNTWRGREYQALNKDMRKANVLYNSLEESLETSGDAALEASGAYECMEQDGIRDLIMEFLKQDRTIEAVILDGIAYHAAFKELRYDLPDRSYIEDPEHPLPFKLEKHGYKHEFSPRMLVKHLSSIDQGFMEGYFASSYGLSEEQADSIYDKLKHSNSTKLYRYIKKTLINLRDDPRLLSHIKA